MSKKEDEPVVEEPQVEDDEAEESDEYDVEVRVYLGAGLLSDMADDLVAPLTLSLPTSATFNHPRMSF